MRVSEEPTIPLDEYIRLAVCHLTLGIIAIQATVALRFSRRSDTIKVARIRRTPSETLNMPITVDFSEARSKALNGLSHLKAASEDPADPTSRNLAIALSQYFGAVASGQLALSRAIEQLSAQLDRIERVRR